MFRWLCEISYPRRPSDFARANLRTIWFAFGVEDIHSERKTLTIGSYFADTLGKADEIFLAAINRLKAR